MPQEFRLLPRQASANAEQLDQLYFFLVGTSVFFTGLICVLILFFVVRYRKGARVNRANAPSTVLSLEIFWSSIPLVIMLISFGWGAALYIEAFSPPEDAIEVFVVGKQWMWKMQHAEGKREINELHVPVGQPIRVNLISEDVIHSFFIPAFRVKQDVLPGRYTNAWFIPTTPGEYRLFCAEYCGTSHSLMRGHVIVQDPDGYAEWIADQTVEPAEVVGRRLFERLRCDSCHQERDMPRGPSLVGLFGRTVQLQNAPPVTADLAYVRESLLDPGAKIAAGYENKMPTYEDQLNEEDILYLMAYMKSLTPPQEYLEP